MSGTPPFVATFAAVVTTNGNILRAVVGGLANGSRDAARICVAGYEGRSVVTVWVRVRARVRARVPRMRTVLQWTHNTPSEGVVLCVCVCMNDDCTNFFLCGMPSLLVTCLPF